MPISKTFDKMFCNVLALGFSFMLVFTAFQTCGMIQNIVISSMKEQYEGYNGNGYIRCYMACPLFRKMKANIDFFVFVIFQPILWKCAELS
ncbi:hypothetical protein HNY73_007022 [Argiope bruennichi]|uniref:Uncharacterized protein n=1 Tax=Argiope bruennichi TaxID=94029 RepID=A0A8T0FFC0_ARGBR|nr:hypothetical protein HNY73_007022 [Argiope bruennichi]